MRDAPLRPTRRRLAAALPLLSLLPLTRAWQWDIVSSASGAPPAREGHSLSLYYPSSSTATQPKIVTCGGAAADGNEGVVAGCWSLDPFSSWRFTPVVSANDTIPRADHAAVVYSGYLVLWGGTPSSSSLSSPSTFPHVSPSFPLRGPAPTSPSCEIISILTWTSQPRWGCTDGTVPASRWGHSGVLYKGGQWVIYGGVVVDPGTGNATDTSDVLVLDLTNMPTSGTWSQPTVVGTPPPRHYHASALFDSSLVVYGGYSFALQDVLDDLWVLPLDGPSAWVWTSLTPSGSTPIPLYGHKAMVVGSLLVLYGGHIAEANGVHAVDLSGGGAAWSTPSVDGDWLRAPFRSAVAVFDADGDADPELVVFGGGIPGSSSSSSSAAAAMRAGAGGGVGNTPGVSSGLAVLSGIGENKIEGSAALPFILGGSAAAAFLLGGLGYMAYSRNRSLAAARQRAREDAAVGRGEDDDEELGSSGGPDDAPLLGGPGAKGKGVAGYNSTAIGPPGASYASAPPGFGREEEEEEDYDRGVGRPALERGVSMRALGRPHHRAGGLEEEYEEEEEDDVASSQLRF